MVQQALSQIRTVAAYGGEDAAQREYDVRLDVPQKVRSAARVAAVSRQRCCCGATGCHVHTTAARTTLQHPRMLLRLPGTCVQVGNRQGVVSGLALGGMQVRPALALHLQALLPAACMHLQPVLHGCTLA